jgi:hypothetical protein
MEAGALDEVCERLDVALLWAVLAERRIMGDHGDKRFAGMKHQSWTGWRHAGSTRWTCGPKVHLLPDRSTVVTSGERGVARRDQE